MEYKRTTAGWKQSFAYEKLMELVVQSVLEPDLCMVMGGTYLTPQAEGQLEEDFVEQQRMSDTYDEGSFQREYCSKWQGDAQNAFFQADIIDKHRVLLQAEWEYSARSSKSAYYVLGVDVGRIGCNTEVVVIKVTPQPQGAALKTVVNIFSYSEEHFETQTINIKRLFFKYKARAIALDGNGIGAAITDYMVKSQLDPESGDILPPFGVINDENGLYKQFRSDDMVRDAVYIIKANAPMNTEAHTYVQSQLRSGHLKMLIEEREAKIKLMGTKMGQQMTPEARIDYLKPYQLTDIIKIQMLNLVSENDGTNIILKQSNKSILKDKFSALEYGLYYVKQEEERKKKRHNHDIGKMMFFTSR